MNRIIGSKLAFRQAENLARKRSVKFWFMTNLLVKKSVRGYLFLCYAYLRWVDNYIDDSQKTFSLKKEFIEHQLNLVNLISSETGTELNSKEEQYIYYYILFAVKNKKSALINNLKNMLETMKMDVYRLQSNGVFNEKDLEKYITCSYGAMFSLVHSFILFSEENNYNYKDLKGFMWYGGTLRDFFEDLNDGYVNITKEDAERFSLNIDNLDKDENLKRWLRYKIDNVIELLNIEISILEKMSFKVKLFWAIAYPYYLHKILRIKMYDYSYGYLQNLNIKNEVKAFVSTIFMGTNTVLRLFGNNHFSNL